MTQSPGTRGAPEGRRALEEATRRQGRKSKRPRIEGDTRHVRRALDTGLWRAVGVTPANAPEASFTAASAADRHSQGAQWIARPSARGDRSSRLVQGRPPELAVYGKVWSVRKGGCVLKPALALAWYAWTLRCPNARANPVKVGRVGHCPAAICAACPFQACGPRKAPGRSVSFHPAEQWRQQLRERQQSPEGRAKRRGRVAVAPALVPVGRWQIRRARYRAGAKICVMCVVRRLSTMCLASLAQLPPLKTWQHDY